MLDPWAIGDIKDSTELYRQARLKTGQASQNSANAAAAATKIMLHIVVLVGLLP